VLRRRRHHRSDNLPDVKEWTAGTVLRPPPSRYARQTPLRPLGTTRRPRRGNYGAELEATRNGPIKRRYRSKRRRPLRAEDTRPTPVDGSFPPTGRPPGDRLHSDPGAGRVRRESHDARPSPWRPAPGIVSTCRRGAGRPRPGRRGKCAYRQEGPSTYRNRHGPCSARRSSAPGQAPHARVRWARGLHIVDGPAPAELPLT